MAAIDCTEQEWASDSGVQCIRPKGDTGEVVHQHTDETWWWVDETWADEYGPFLTKELAEESLDKYVKEVLR